ncbi:MAG TPA: tripartite tricarboxylate transporter substrate binding protein [Burkholderiales bacterium]|nr:tripartite tricarboxylate transporter substrate binding protein [Burkholderiales bacterium]
MSTQRERFTRFAAALALAGAAGVAHAQAFPSRPITIVIPFPPGGISDNSTRVISQKAAAGLGQPIVIENRPGAGGQIGADVVKGAKPDGHTLFLANIGSHGINQSLYSKLSYDPMKDFEPITILFSSPTLLVVPASSPVKSMAELIAYAKTKPGKASYGSQSIGSGGHLSGEIVKMKNGLDLIHVPYKGSAPALTDLVAGRIDFLFDPITTALPFVKDGKLRALAITSDKRSPLVPDVPTLAELGYVGYDVNPWFGLAAPAGTPRPIIDRLNAEFSKAAKDPEVVKRLADQGIEAMSMTPEQFAEFIRSETARWTEVVKSSGAKAD